MSTPVPVTLIFEGVLVGRYDKASKIFEMGVLPVPSHTFSIAIKEHIPVSAAGNAPEVKNDDIPFNEIEITPDDAQWRLEIPGSAPSATLFLPDVTPPDRKKLPENEFGKLDYRWVIDLERDLPNHAPGGATELPRHDGLLKPVLNITVGEFYAKKIFRASVSSRQGGKGEHQAFGFVPQQVGADFTVEAGKEVLLKKIDSGKDVFRLKVEEGHSYTILFRNTPPDEQDLDDPRPEEPLPKPDVNRPTHFQLLYLLFNVPPENRYELRVLPTPATPTPNISALAIAEEFMEARRPQVLGVPNPRCSPTGTGGG